MKKTLALIIIVLLSVYPCFAGGKFNLDFNMNIKPDLHQYNQRDSKPKNRKRNNKYSSWQNCERTVNPKPHKRCRTYRRMISIDYPEKCDMVCDEWYE